MIIFWVVAGSLIAAALLFVLPPLLGWRPHGEAGLGRKALTVSIYRDQLAELEADLREDILSQEQYEQGRQELERRLLEDVSVDDVSGAQGKLEQDKLDRGTTTSSRVTALVLAVALPSLAVLLYLQIGSPEGLAPPAAMTANGDPAHGDTAQQMEALVTDLAQRLEQDPSDVEGWAMLARTLAALGHYPQAVTAFSQIMNLVAPDPELLTDYADTLAMASGESLEGEPIRLLQQALSIDPNHQKALWLVGTREFERGNFRGAIDYWQRLYATLPPMSEAGQTIAANIAEAESWLDKSPGADFGAPASGGAPVNQAHVAGVVKLDASLLDRVAPQDTVFVFVRAASGPKMPLATIRTRVSALPYQFDLDDADAVMPTFKLSDFAKVIVGARVSKSGEPMASSGDLQGFSSEVEVGAGDIAVMIDTVVP